MKIIESILTKNDCYKSNRQITVKGLMIHSVGCSQPSAMVFVNSWNKPASEQNGRQVCVHGFIDGNTGDIHQTLPWNWRGWHCGSGANGSGNNTHIGVEMCEPATITYTGGANFTDNNPENTKTVVMRTYKAAVELFAFLCDKYNLDPLADGVVISHKEGCARGIASNHGDPEHLWGKFNLTMAQFRKDIKSAMNTIISIPDNSTFKGTAIMGSAVATAEQMAAYLISKNADAKDYAAEYARLFINEGNNEGVRGDVAFAQSCLETGNFKFGGDVKPEQNNFAGIGATGGGAPGNSFTTPQEGIRAQIQHLKAYASTAALNNACVDPRFQYVTRGCAEFVEWLGQKENPNGKGWAVGADYGAKIITILNAMIGTIETPKTPDPEPSNTLYRVQVGAFGKKEYAERLKTELQGKGYDAFIVYIGGYYKVQIGAYGVKKNAEAAISGMKAAGYDAFITTATTETPAPVTPSKSIEELAKEVIAGKWGNGQERKQKLTAAGYDYNAVQAKVNALLK